MAVSTSLTLSDGFYSWLGAVPVQFLLHLVCFCARWNACALLYPHVTLVLSQ